MKDQAYKLRALVNKKKNNELEDFVNDDANLNETSESGTNDARVITITSGKGGVGKTNFTSNLAIALSRKGFKVVVVDADLSLGNVDVVMGVVARSNVSSVLDRDNSISDVVISGPEGVDIVSGGSGITDLIDLSNNDLDHIVNSFKDLNDSYDYILIDTGAGISHSVTAFVQAAHEVIIVLNAEPTSLTDSYALIKNIDRNNKKIRLVINRVDSEEEGVEVFQKINSVSTKFLGYEVEKLGIIYEDKLVRKAIKQQVPVIIKYPESIASSSIEIIASNLVFNMEKVHKVSSFKRFMLNLLSSR